ncbi:hypothetical protein [Streptomyces sp. NPDC096068]|uniref:hypothetical protein n=1 Tax=Streptomyces sp. NPDC096068 TaxID=3155424 RepID=UPI00331B8CAE
MLIEGYDDGPLTAGEPLLDRPGFWSNHLPVLCADGDCAERPDPEWFGDDGADADALSEVLFDPGHWPVFRVPAGTGPGAVVVYRNLAGDHGTDYLLTDPDGGGARRIARWDADFTGAGLTWRELTGIADGASSTAEVTEAIEAAEPAEPAEAPEAPEAPEASEPAEGVRDIPSRLLLLLPLLTDPDIPEEASARVAAALTEVGAPAHTASATADHLLAHLARRSRHDPAWASPLSGG